MSDNLSELEAAEREYGVYEPDGAAILAETEAFLRRFVAFPSDAAAVAATLWTAHAHAVDAFESTPRLAALSPEPASGKTRLLEILALLVPNPMHAISATSAALFRAVADQEARPTILFDEIDTIFGPKAKENEELRALLNAGHRRSGVAYRCVGEGTKQKSTPFPAYAAVALAGLGDLPDTIFSRSIVIRMRRRAPHERVEPYRARRHDPHGHDARDRLAEWVAQVAPSLEVHWPDMPDGIEDRPADVWEPLLAIADLAGADWPERARSACVELVQAAQVSDSASLGVRLLADTREVFGDEPGMHTETLLERLREIDEAPWGNLRGSPLDSRRLARMLGKYDIYSTNVKVAGIVRKGYRRGDFWDAWMRYLPSPSDKSATSATSATGDEKAQNPAASEVADTVADNRKVADTSATPDLNATPEPPENCEKYGGSGGSASAAEDGPGADEWLDL